MAPPRYSCMQNYTDGDILLVLKKLQETQVGRKNLSEFLALGEATVRTLFRKLESHQFIESTQKGQKITEKGEHYLTTLPYFTLPQKVTVKDITLSTHSIASLVRNFSTHVKNGMQFRDAAIIAGASGATTLIFKNGGFVFPYGNTELTSKIQDYLIEKFSPSEDDVLIIATAETEQKAVRGLSGSLGLLIQQDKNL